MTETVTTEEQVIDPIFFEKMLLKLLFVNEDVRDKVYPHLKPELFDVFEHQNIVQDFLAYKEKYEKFAKVSELKLYSKDKEVFETLLDVMKIDETEFNSSQLLDEVESFFKEKLIWNDINAMVDALKEDVDKAADLPDKMRDSFSFSFDTSVGLDFIDDFDTLYEAIHNHDKTVSSGIKIIDQIIDGGFHEKSITLFLAGTNVGKTLVQCAFGCNALPAPPSVPEKPTEEDEKKISKRFVSNLLDIEINDLKLVSREKLKAKHDKIKKQVSEKLIIKEYPEGTISANHIRNLLKELEMKKKFKPDIVFVDYIGCMNPNGKVNTNINSNDTLRLVTGQVRALGMEFGFPVISAMQANRGGINSSELDLTDAADSIGQAFKADAIFSITQTDELKEAGLYNCKLIKSRFGLNSYKFSMGVDVPKMRLFDWDDDNIELSATPKPPPGVQKDIVDDAAVKMVKSGMKDNKDVKRKKLMGLNFK